MYIEKLTLVIIAEVFIVMLLMAAFLLYKSRLYQLLRSILQKQNMSRHSHSDFINNEEPIFDSHNPGYLSKEILQSLLKQLNQHSPNQLPSQIFDELPKEEKVPFLRKQFYLLEQELAKGHFDPDIQKSVLDRFLNSINLSNGLNEQDEIKSLKKQLHKLDSAKVQLESKDNEIDNLQNIINEYQRINTIELDHSSAPNVGEYSDEIYKLKCDKFEFMEEITASKAKIKQARDDADDAKIIEQQQLEITQLEHCVKESDIIISLLEKELNSASGELQKLSQAISNSQQVTLNPEAISTGMQETIAKLVDIQSTQKRQVNKFKKELSELHEDEQLNELVDNQQTNINNFEQNLTETEALIKLLQSDIEHNIETLNKEQDLSNSLNINSDENDKNYIEMEELLQKFITDSQEMLSTISDLEAENKLLIEQLSQFSENRSASDPI